MRDTGVCWGQTFEVFSGGEFIALIGPAETAAGWLCRRLKNKTDNIETSSHGIAAGRRVTWRG